MIFGTKKITMKEKNTFICICVFILLSICPKANSQNCEVLNQYIDSIYTKEEIHTLEKQICFLLEKQQAVPEDNKVNIYYIPIYDMPYYSIMPPDSIKEYYSMGKSGWRIKKSDLIDGSFLKRLSRYESPRRIKKRSKTYISADVIVTNSSDSLIATGNASYLYITERCNKSSYDSKRFLIEKMRELKIKRLFKFQLWLFPIFGITENNEIVVFLYDNGYKLCSIKEFADSYSKKEPYKSNFYD